VAEHLREAILHALVAALCIEALVRVWRVEEPTLRLRLRGIAVALPSLYLPALELWAPFRHSPWFEARWALFVGRRFQSLELLGMSLSSWWLYGLGSLGLALFLRDFLPSAAGAFERQWLEVSPPAAVPGALSSVEALAAAMGVRRPALELLDCDEAFLHCRGALRTTVVVSRGTLEALDERELRAALAHELEHHARSDVRTGWLLMAARAFQAFNPVVQVVSRAITRDADRRADDAAALATGDRLSVASGLLKLFRATGGRAPVWWPLVARAREENVEERCRRMLAPPAPGAPPFARVQLAMAAAGLAGLLFFVT